MDTYIEVAYTLYSAALQYINESQGIVAGSEERRIIAGAGRSRLEDIAVTAGVLATDVLLNKPQIKSNGLKKIVPISSKKSDIGGYLELKNGVLRNHISGIQARTGFTFRFAR